MNSRHLVDPQLLPFLDIFPSFNLTDAPLKDIRESGNAQFAILPPPILAPENIVIPGTNGAPDIGCLLFRPEKLAKNAGAILHIHGGGMVIGSAETFSQGPSAMAATLGIPILSVDYRLAPEHPFPAPQEDCYAALKWLADQADNLGFNADRIVVTGESAGGGLAASLAHMARDKGGPSIAGQILVYPMIDHRSGGDVCPYDNPTSGEFIWTRGSNQFGWNALQGDYGADDDRKGWFSPSIADDLSRLPPAYIATATLDLFFDENLDYARRMAMAGVSVELHSYPGAFHGFDLMAEADISKRFHADLLAAAARMAG